MRTLEVAPPQIPFHVTQPPDRLPKTTWGELFPTSYLDGRCSRLSLEHAQ